MRKRLSPETKTTINEVGAISADDTLQEQPGHVTHPIPNAYWNLTCAMSAYLFGEMTKMGIDVWRRISTGRVSDTISQRFDGRLEYGQTKRSSLGLEVIA